LPGHFVDVGPGGVEAGTGKCCGYMERPAHRTSAAAASTSE
jgi:hypothetical protein